MPTMVKITCACGCGQTRMVRKADVNRGWGNIPILLGNGNKAGFNCVIPKEEPDHDETGWPLTKKTDG